MEKLDIRGRLSVMRKDGGVLASLPDGRTRLNREDAMQLRDFLSVWLHDTQPADDAAEQQCLVALGDVHDNGPPLVILGLSEAGWDYCKDGMAHQFDLSPVGCNVRILLTGGKTQASIAEQFMRGASMTGATWNDQRKKLPTLGIQSGKPS